MPSKRFTSGFGRKARCEIAVTLNFTVRLRHWRSRENANFLNRINVICPVQSL
ncbi:hypothetical protein SAMN05443247_11090 [Bradyrhizobium erythrophlei]|nr:hypothetical protein SAMN05443247_11090 [Bradyrhizobium erythrophlei]